MFLTSVNYFSNYLIIKNGMFFELLIRCLFSSVGDKNNKKLILISTLLTVHHKHH